MSPTFGKTLLTIFEYVWFSGVGAFLLFAPGFLLAHYGIKKKWWRDSGADLLMALLCGSGIVAYLTFWVHFLDHRVGKAFSLVVILATLVSVADLFKKKGPAVLKNVRVPFLFLLLACLFYGGILRSRSPTELTSVLPSRVMDVQLPYDNVIPFMFGSRLATHEDPRDMGATWRSSDRPPLQAGFWLMVRPVFRPLHLENEGYQIVGTLLQLSWVLALFALMATWGRNASIPFFFCLFSSFFFINSIFVWPKLLAATYCVFVYILLLVRPPKQTNLILASIAMALAMLSHGGSAFAMLILIPAWAIFRAPKTLPTLSKIAVPAFVVFLPWMLYQKFYDPPGDRLVKVHLAGVLDVDVRSAGRAIADAYAALPSEKIVTNKLSNLGSYFYGIAFSHWTTADAVQIRQGQFIALGHALDILNFALLIVIFFLVKHRHREKEVRPLLWAVAACAAIYVVWSLLMFRPYNSVLYLGTYFLPIMAYFALSSLLVVFSRRLALGLLAVHAILFAYLWAVTYRSAITRPGFLWLLVALFALVSLIAVSRQQRSTFS